MLKLTFCLHRLPHLTREEFQEYWRGTHGPLVARHAETLGIRRYVQSHSLTLELNDTIGASRGAPQMYDGVAELWWDSLEQFAEAGQAPGAEAAAAELLEDERKFIDHARSPLWFSTCHGIVG